MATCFFPNEWKQLPGNCDFLNSEVLFLLIRCQVDAFGSAGMEFWEL